MIRQILKNQLVRYLLVLVLGIGFGAIFYPTSNLEEKIKQKHEEEFQTIIELKINESKLLTNELDKKSLEFRSYKEESEKKIQFLTVQVQSLQTKQKTSYYKLIKPDGTIEVKKFSESEVKESQTAIVQIQEEFKTKVASIEEKWETIHKKRVEDVKKDFQQKEDFYKKRLDELEKNKIVKKNEKSFGVEGGMNTEKQYYIHGTGDLYGPLFMGIHTESDKDFNKKSIGMGLGVKF